MARTIEPPDPLDQSRSPHWKLQQRILAMIDPFQESPSREPEFQGQRRVVRRYNGISRKKLRIATEHVYRVAALGVLVHNSCGKTNTVYQLLDKKSNVRYYGIVGDARAATRLGEHLKDGKKAVRMEILASGLERRAAETMEGMLIRKRLDKFRLSSSFDEMASIRNKLDGAGLWNKIRGLTPAKWIDDVTKPTADGVLQTLIKINKSQ